MTSPQHRQYTTDLPPMTAEKLRSGGTDLSHTIHSSVPGNAKVLVHIITNVYWSPEPDPSSQPVDEITINGLVYRRVP
jgi:hypothetical protein